MAILVTGGAGFIGSHFVNGCEGDVAIIDNLTYAADLKRIANKKAKLFRMNIRSKNGLDAMLAQIKPSAIFHFAAETHVTKSIIDPDVFFRNNVDGTLNLLQSALKFWKKEKSEAFRFVHISTDEVFGSLGPGEKPFTEVSAYRPSTPYAASKAAADHLVRCFGITYGFPACIVNSTNNYGIGQHKEKLIPLVISSIRSGKPVTVHGDGLGTRDWIHVEDFCAAVRTICDRGEPGESYCVSAENEKTVMAVVQEIIGIMGRGEIVHVEDRPGNDRRYALNPAKLKALGWRPKRAWDLKALCK